MSTPQATSVHRRRLEATIPDFGLAEYADEYIALHERIDAAESKAHRDRERIASLESQLVTTFNVLLHLLTAEVRA